jgi:signal transduction histidine kinase
VGADAEALATCGLEHRVSVDGSNETAVVARAVENMRERLIVEQHVRVDFLATASHELRTPLASLQAVLELQEELSAAPPTPARSACARKPRSVRRTG